MGMINKVYDHSPIFFQNILASASGYVKNRRMYNKIYYKHRKFLADFDAWNLERKLSYQNEELVKFIKFAVTKSKFYRNLYKDIDLTTITTISDLKKLPVVDKDMIRKNIDDIVTMPKKKASIRRTGGTTGKSLVVYKCKVDMIKRLAMLDHFKARVGFEMRKMRCATFTAQHLIPANQTKKVFWRYNKAHRRMMYSSFHLTEENMRYYINSLNSFKPQAIDGLLYMTDIAKYIEKHDIKLSFKPMAIFPTGETLTTPTRALLERVFGCKVYNQYASSEGAPFITDCPKQNLHIELSTGVFEFFEEDSNEILVTSFTTHGTPLIRYRIGDSIETLKTNKQCDCGIKGPIIKEILGRNDDFLYTAEGAKIRSSSVANLVKDIPNAIIKLQAVQDKVDEIRLLLEIDENLYQVEYDDILKKVFVNRFGKKTNILIEHVKHISKEKSGKFRLVKNNVVNTIIENKPEE